MDYLPTFAALAGVKLPADRAYDGIDISNVLLHGATEAHTTLFHPTGRGSPTHSVPAMRMGKQADSIVYLAPGNQSGSLRLAFCGGVCGRACGGVRAGKYKAFFRTQGSTSCRDHTGQPRTGKATAIDHDPPLIFDLSKDLAEST